MLGIVMDGVHRLRHPGAQAQGLPRVRVDVKAGIVAAGDVDPDPVPRPEEVARGVGDHLEAICPPRFEELGLFPRAVESRPEYGVRQVHGVAVGVVGARGVVVHQLQREIRVEGRRRDVEVGSYRPGDLYGPFQGRGLEDEDVAPGG